MAKEIIYEPHPVSKERKAELVAKGYQIIDAIYDPNPKPAPKPKRKRLTLDVPEDDK